LRHALFLLLFLAIWALIARLYGRKLSTLPQSRRLIVLAVLLVITAVGPVELLSGWALAIPVLSGVAFGLSSVAYILAIIAAWVCADGPRSRWLGRGFSIVLALPGLGLAISLLKDPIGLLVVLAFALGTREQSRASGRISATLTYKTSTISRAGEKSTSEAYEIYRNPRWFPLIRTSVGEGPTDCESGRVTFSPGRDEHTILMSCQLTQPWRGMNALTTEVPLR
jgi:hypothetical protein